MRCLLAVCLLFGIAIAQANDNPEPAVAAAIHSSIEALPNTQTKALTIGGLSLTQAIAKFYATRSYSPAWNNAEIAKQLLVEIDNLRSDGLDPEDYQLTALRTRFAQLPAADAMTAAAVTQRAAFDVMATRSYLLSLMHLFRGKVNPATLDPEWNFKRNDMALNDAMQIINGGAVNDDIHAVYERARTQHPFYLHARTALAQLRQIAAQGGWPRLDTTITLKPGVTDPSIIALRKRFLPDTASSPNADVYDDTLVAAVKNFQREQYFNDDGVIGAKTRAALNVSIQQRIDQVRVNLERGRWLLNQMQNDFVLVDIAGYKIYFFRDGKQIWQSQVQVGKPYRKTPIFQSNINYITFNPTWTVPPTILRKDVLPKIRKDVSYLAKNNMRVLSSSGRELDPNTIDWDNPGNIVIRQDAGGDNASLGQVVIRFPNDYAVYLHDTPHRELFGNTQRAFSSGCIRVERPFELVELLFNDPKKWNHAAIEQFVAQGQTRNVNLPKPVPVLLAYWTIDLFNNDQIGFKPDIYNRDPAVLKALNARLNF